MTSSLFLMLLVSCGQSSSAFDFRTLSTATITGDIKSLAGDGTIELADGQQIKSGDWYQLRRAETALPAWPSAPHLEFLNGDRIRGTIVSIDADVVRLRLAVAGPEQVLRFPISSVRIAWLTRRSDEDPVWLADARKRDAVLSRSGGITLGALASLNSSTNRLRLQIEGQDQEIDVGRVAAIGFNSDLARLRRPKGAYYRLTLSDGTRLSATSVSFDGKVWIAQTLFKEKVNVRPADLLSIDIEQGKVAWLSDLKPIDYQYRSFVGEQFDWAANRCVTGQPIRLKTTVGESTFDRGIGLHSECSICYALDGKFKRFEALAGLDAQSGQQGNVELAIVLDGKETKLSNNGRLSFADKPLALRMDVSGVKEMTIIVRQANGGNVQDHVNLAQARLVP